MKNKNVLFIVEGKNDEPRFVEQMLKKCFPSVSYNVYSYEANLHMLAARLEKDYDDFENDELDILLFLKSYDRENADIFDRKYTDIFMIFDFEPQHPDCHFGTIRKMIQYFGQSEDHGKLFINYPMMQSYRHLKSLPDKEFLTSKLTSEDFGHYKHIVSDQSFNNDVSTYDYIDFISLTYHHLTKPVILQTEGKTHYPDRDSYESLDYTEIFDDQCRNLNRGFIWIVNTCILIPIDYNPSSFFNQISNHRSSFLLPA